MPIRSIGKLLTDDVGAIASKERSYRLLRFRVRTFHIFQVIILITVRTVVGKRSVRTETILVDIKIDAFCQNTVPADLCRVANTTYGTGGLISNDVDNTSDGIGTIKRRGCSVEYLDTLDPRHIDAVQIYIIRDVA